MGKWGTYAPLKFLRTFFLDIHTSLKLFIRTVVVLEQSPGPPLFENLPRELPHLVTVLLADMAELR